jgi:hypothetical protein
MSEIAPRLALRASTAVELMVASAVGLTRRAVHRLAGHAGVGVVLVTGLLPLGRAGGQAVRELRVERCQKCTLTRRVVAILGRPDDTVLVTPFSTVVRLGGARYLVAPVSEPGQLAIYRSDGALERVIGREGRGPLEYSRHVGPIIGSASRGAVVVDIPNRRLTLIDSLGNAGTYGRWPTSVYAGASLPDGRLVLNSEFRTPDRFGVPLHIVERGGRIIRSFGAVAGPIQPHSRPAVRIVAPARDGGLWVAPNDKYELSLTDSTGRVSITLSRPLASPRGVSPSVLPFFIASIREDNDGNVWVVSGLRRTVPARGKEGPVDYRSMKAVLDGLTSTIDVIDPKRGTIIYSPAFSEPPTPVIADGLAYRYREDADGNPRIELISVRLTRE